jgi:hypothetical protein
MATRMQQRRGTTAQWTSADPILASGEIGFESDSGKFKIGDGINHWSALSYYASADDIAGLIDGAPELLNTLNELAAAIGDDPDFINTMASKEYLSDSIDTHNQDTTGVHGILDTSQLATLTTVAGEIDSALGGHNLETTNVHGILNTADLATKSYSDSAVSDHNAETTNIHGILDTSVLATATDVTNAQNDAETFATDAVSTHNSDTTGVHGIADTSVLATQTDIANTENYADDAVSTHNLVTLNVHGIADTSVLATDTDVSNAIDAAAVASENYTDAHEAKTTSIHGIADTAALATKSYADSAVSTHQADTTSVHGIADTSKLVTTDAAAQTLSGNLTVTGNLTVSGTTTTVSTSDLVVSDSLIYVGEGNSANLIDLGIVSSFNDGTYQHSGIVRDSSDNKWKLFKGVTDEPTTTINFAQGSLDALAVGALEATTVTPSSGVVFSDGTQTKEGVPSRTPIVQKTASYTLSALTERDSLIEISSASAVTLTVPPNSSVAFPVGTSLDVLQTGAGQITIAAGAGVTINATPGLKLRTQWSGATLFKRAADTWVLYGDLSA